MITPAHLTRHVIEPALERMGMHSASAVELLLGTAKVESHCGLYLVQLGDGPAKGIYQMEPATHNDIVDNYLKYKDSLRITLLSYCGIDHFSPDRLVWDLRYATIFARLHYRRVKEALPDADDIRAQASYWKRHYNTVKGKGTIQKYLEAAERYS